MVDPQTLLRGPKKQALVCAVETVIRYAAPFAPLPTFWQKSGRSLQIVRAWNFNVQNNLVDADDIPVLIRLSQTPTRCSGRNFGIKLGIIWRGDITGDAEQGSEGIEGVEAAIELELELVVLRLQVLWAETMMDTSQPGIEIGEHEANDRQEGFGQARR